MMAIVAGVLPEFPGVLHDNWLEFEQPLMEICAECWAQDPSDRPDAETVLEKLRQDIIQWIQLRCSILIQSLAENKN